MPTATTRTRGSRAPAAHPAVVAGAIKNGDNIAAEAPVAAKKAPSVQVYVTALKDAMAFHRKAFYVEMAVCLVFFANAGTADKKTRTAIRPIYEKAGYDCKDKKGEDYNTVQRRTAVAASLYDWLGAEETLKDWIEDAKPAESIAAVAARLEKQRFDSIQAVRKAVEAEKVKQEQAQAKKRQVERAQAEAAKLAAQGPAQASVPATPAPAPAPQEGQPAAEAGPPMSEAEQAALAGAAERSEERKVAGEPAPAPAQNRRAEDRLPPDRVLRTEHLRLAIPEGTPWMELLQLSAQLNVVAQRMQVEEQAKARALAH